MADNKTKAQLLKDIEKLQRENLALKQNENKFNAIANYTSNVEEWYSPDGELLWISPSVFDILGYTPQECYDLSTDYFSTIIHPDHFERCSKLLDEVISEKKSGKNLEYQVIKKDGSSCWVSTTWRPIYLNGKYAGIRFSNEDISEKKVLEFQLRDLIKEKEMLITEINHRVKNNLSILISLINLQVNSVKDMNTKNKLNDVANRIRVLCMIHESLHKTENIEIIHMKEYLDSLITCIYESLVIDKSRIKIDLAIDNISLNVKKAISCGLIINELLTNTLKYAFPFNKKGIIAISCKAENNTILKLRIKDNGVGLPDDFDINYTTGFGITIVKLLLDQLDGSLDINSDNGAEFCINFAL